MDITLTLNRSAAIRIRDMLNREANALAGEASWQDRIFARHLEFIAETIDAQIPSDEEADAAVEAEEEAGL